MDHNITRVKQNTEHIHLVYHTFKMRLSRVTYVGANRRPKFNKISDGASETTEPHGTFPDAFTQ